MIMDAVIMDAEEKLHHKYGAITNKRHVSTTRVDIFMIAVFFEPIAHGTRDGVNTLCCAGGYIIVNR